MKKFDQADQAMLEVVAFGVALFGRIINRNSAGVISWDRTASDDAKAAQAYAAEFIKGSAEIIREHAAKESK
jgi:hypothetical protein